MPGGGPQPRVSGRGSAARGSSSGPGNSCRNFQAASAPGPRASWIRTKFRSAFYSSSTPATRPATGGELGRKGSAGRLHPGRLRRASSPRLAACGGAGRPLRGAAVTSTEHQQPTKMRASGAREGMHAPRACAAAAHCAAPARPSDTAAAASPRRRSGPVFRAVRRSVTGFPMRQAMGAGSGFPYAAAPCPADRPQPRAARLWLGGGLVRLGKATGVFQRRPVPVRAYG